MDGVGIGERDKVGVSGWRWDWRTGYGWDRVDKVGIGERDMVGVSGYGWHEWIWLVERDMVGVRMDMVGVEGYGWDEWKKYGWGTRLMACHGNER